MRPDRFTQLLIAAARTLPDTTAEPVAEDRKKRPYLDLAGSVPTLHVLRG